MSDENQAGKTGKWGELGSLGINAFAGYIMEAYARELYWPTVEPLYTKMWRSDPEVTIARNVFESLAGKLRVEFVTPPDVEKPTDDDKKAVDFGNEVLDDVEGGIGQWLVTCMTRLPFYGWGWWEVVPGLRKEGWRPPGNDDWRSEYDDGMIGYRRLAFRQYSSFWAWDMDDTTGRVNGFQQNDPPNPLITIPKNRSLHLTFGDSTNPEGLATLEAVWRLERIKFGLEVIQMIGFEHSAGYAKFTADEDLSSEDKTYLKKVARSLLAAKEGNYLALPGHIQGDIMDTTFQSAVAIMDSIRYYGILKLALFHMQWAALGVLSPYGSYSTIKDANQFFVTLFNSMVTGFSVQADEQVGKRLYEYPINAEQFPNMTRRPVLQISKAEKIVDLEELGAFMTAANAVFPLGDEDFIAIRRKSEVLPETLPEVDEREKPDIPTDGESIPGAEDDAEESMDAQGGAEQDENTNDEGVDPEDDENLIMRWPTLTELQQSVNGYSDGVMIAFRIPRDAAERLAGNWEGALSASELHLTLAFLGNMDDLAADRDVLLQSVEQFAQWMPPIAGKVSGIGTFFETDNEGKNATYASFDSPNLPGFRQALVKQLREDGLPVKRNHGFTPHITLAYSESVTPIDYTMPTGIDIEFDEILLAIGDEEYYFPLNGRPAVLAVRPFQVAGDERPFYPASNDAYPTEEEIARAVRSFRTWAKKNRPGWEKLLNADELPNPDEEKELSFDPNRWPLDFGATVELNGAWLKNVRRWGMESLDQSHLIPGMARLADWDRTVVSRRQFKIFGYEIRTENVEFDGEKIEIKSAYVIETGDYIGDSRMARYLMGELGVMPELASKDHSVCSIGYSEQDQKYYGWSHRAICGFAIGDRIFDPEYGTSDTPFTQHGQQVIRSKMQQRQAAIAFAEYVS